MDIVVDASVAVKWFNIKGEDNVELALKIQKQKIANKIVIIVPDLFFLEIVNAFLAKSFFDRQDVLIIEEALDKLNLVVVYPDHLTLKNSINIAYENNLTIYDAIYIAIAIANNAILLTEDKKILSCKGRCDFIKSLEEFEELALPDMA
jgi:predicted nucleic acid-binding protein